jgi:hypothetical protein
MTRLRRFTSCFLIPGPNGGTIAGALSPRNFCPASIARSLVAAYSTLPLITRITFVKSNV